jgi:hypothetical protein
MRHLLLFTLLLLALTGCREEGVMTTTRTTGTTPPPEVITTFVTSVVVDQNGTPLDDATITGLGDAARRNPDGSLRIDAGALSTEGTLVTVTSPGHWPERRVLVPAGGGQLVETFVLEEKIKAGEISPATGGTINLGPGFSVTLPANTVVTTTDGAAYDGPVEVYINHDAPEDRLEMLNSPGNARARLPDGSLANLESFGMMDIALESPDGTPLQLSDATPAEVRMPLKAASIPTAPDVIDFWVLDPEGFWLPAGTATLGADGYVVFITLSGGYNCDVPRPAARLCARVVTPSGIPITHLPFSIDITGGFSCWNATLDCDGEFCAWVAAGTDLQLVLSDECTGERLIVDLAPIPVGTQFDAGEVVIDFGRVAFITNVNSCGSGLPDVGQTEIWVNGYGSPGGFVGTLADGTAYVSGENCESDDMVIQSFTRDYRAASRLVRRSGDDASPQTLNVCGDLELGETFTLSIDGAELTIAELAPIYWPDNGNFDWLVRAAATFAGEEYSLLLRFKDPATGAPGPEDVSAAIFRLEPGQNYGQGRVYVDPTNSLRLTNVTYDAGSKVFAADYTATMNLQNDATTTVEAVDLPVAGAFRIQL